MTQLFYQISEKEKAKLLKRMDATTLSYKKDKTILSTFKNTKFVGIIISGAIEIIRTDYNGNRTILEELEEGEIFTSYLYSLENKEYSIVTKEDTEIMIIDYFNILNHKMDTSYSIQFLKNLMEITNAKIQENNNRISILTKKTIRDKLLEYFSFMSKKSGSKNIYLPFTFTDLADYLAVDRSAMSRELGHLKEEKLITIKKRKITLLY